MRKKIFCICIILFFMAGILGDTDQTNILCRSKGASAVWTETSAQDHSMLLSVDSLQEMADFQIMTDAGTAGSNLLQAVGGRTLIFLAVAVCLQFVCISLVGRLYSEEKKIFVFRIVSFIHRTDGKKKSCFAKEKQIKTGGFQSEGWYKV